MEKNKMDVVSLQEEYKSLNSKFEDYRQELTRQISTLILKDNIHLAFPIQSRVKSWNSVADKLDQKRFVPKFSIVEMQDLVGLRIILLFKKDVKVIATLINENFDVLNEYNTEDKLDDDQFGYSSVHQVIKLAEHWLKIPTLSDFAHIKSEIQIRTLSQHTWAEASNIFQYKSEDNVPKPLKRTISRISALLETVDLEFERLIIERQEYKKEITDTADDSKSKERLNVDLLMKILDEKLPMKNKDINNENYSELIDNLTDLDILTAGDLVSLIDKNLEKALLEDRQKAKEILKAQDSFYTNSDIKRARKGIFFIHSGLIRIMLNYHIGKNWWDEIALKNKL